MAASLSARTAYLLRIEDSHNGSSGTVEPAQLTPTATRVARGRQTLL